jgi:hypothetical protein
VKVEWNGLCAGHLVASEKTDSLNAHETGESLFNGYWDEPFQHPWVARVRINMVHSVALCSTCNQSKFTVSRMISVSTRSKYRLCVVVLSIEWVVFRTFVPPGWTHNINCVFRFNSCCSSFIICYCLNC